MSNLKTMLVIFILFCLVSKMVFVLKSEHSVNENVAILCLALLFTVVLSKVTCIKDMFTTGTNYEEAGTEGTNNRMLQITRAKGCLGGSYLSQGDSPQAVFCRNLAKTHPEEIADYQCNKWFSGYPLQPKETEYTPESNSSWINSRCSVEGPKPGTCAAKGVF